MSPELNTVNTALTIFNEVYNNITKKKEIIESNKTKLKALQSSVDEYDDLSAENRNLAKEIKADRELIKQTIDFYEKTTGEAVGVGELFNQE